MCTSSFKRLVAELEVESNAQLAWGLWERLLLGWFHIGANQIPWRHFGRQQVAAHSLFHAGRLGIGEDAVFIANHLESAHRRKRPGHRGGPDPGGGGIPTGTGDQAGHAALREGGTGHRCAGL